MHWMHQLLMGAVLVLLTQSAAIAAGPKPIGTVSFVGRAGLEGLAVVAYQWTVSTSQLPGAGGGAVGKAGFGAFHVTKFLDEASPRLYDLTASSTPVPTVRLDVTIRRGVTATYELTDVIVSATDRHTAATGPPLQEVALTALAVKETIVSPGGTVMHCFSVKLNDVCN